MVDNILNTSQLLSNEQCTAHCILLPVKILLEVNLIECEGTFLKYRLFVRGPSGGTVGSACAIDVCGLTVVSFEVVGSSGVVVFSVVFCTGVVCTSVVGATETVNLMLYY